VTDILANEIIAGDAHHLLTSNIAEAMQDLRHTAGNRGLARARIAGKAHMQGGLIGLKPHHPTRALDQQQRRHLADTGLDRDEADQLAIESIERCFDVALGIEPGEINILRHDRPGFHVHRVASERHG
jgi:hypothetical protein